MQFLQLIYLYTYISSFRWTNYIYLNCSLFLLIMNLAEYQERYEFVVI